MNTLTAILVDITLAQAAEIEKLLEESQIVWDMGSPQEEKPSEFVGKPVERNSVDSGTRPVSSKGTVQIDMPTLLKNCLRRETTSPDSIRAKVYRLLVDSYKHLDIIGVGPFKKYASEKLKLTPDQMGCLVDAIQDHSLLVVTYN